MQTDAGASSTYTQDGGVKKIESITLSELNAYVLSSPPRLASILPLSSNSILSFMLLTDKFADCIVSMPWEAYWTKWSPFNHRDAYMVEL